MLSSRKRSALVGLLSAGMDAGLFAVCTFLWAGMSALVVARGLCACSSAIFNFSANRSWAFGSNGNVHKQLLRYVVAAAAGIGITTTIWWLIESRTGWNPRLVHLLSLLLVWVLFTYPVLRRWVFDAREDAAV